jgi:hypothetical protein
MWKVRIVQEIWGQHKKWKGAMGNMKVMQEYKGNVKMQWWH